METVSHDHWTYIVSVMATSYRMCTRPTWKPEKAEKSIAVMTSGEDAKGITAAIDYGTASCSVAYCTGSDQAIQNLHINPGKPRVPTALLLQKTGNNKYAVEKFGATAQETIQAFGRDEHRGHSYFEFFKMQIHQKVSKLIKTSF